MNLNKNMLIAIFIFLLFCVVFFMNAQDKQKKEVIKDQDSTKVDLYDEVLIIFKEDCSTAGCHRGKFPKAGLNLEQENILAELINVSSKQIDSLKLVDTKSPERSYLLMKIKGGKGILKNRMPIEAPPLKAAEIKIIDKTT